MTCQLIWELEHDQPDVELRLRPLREHWEARGPGMLSQIQSQLPWLEFPGQVCVHLVGPRKGGAGWVLSPKRIKFEAVLFNPLPQLPEVVRLGWLCACLSLGDQRDAAAMIPPAIHAAEHVELATADVPTIQCALQHWFDSEVSFISAAELLAWWQQIGRSAKSRTDWLCATKEI